MVAAKSWNGLGCFVFVVDDVSVRDAIERSQTALRHHTCAKTLTLSYQGRFETVAAGTLPGKFCVNFA